MEQRLLFELRSPTWIDLLWRRIPPEKRREAISLLAEMARRSLSSQRPREAKERTHES